MTVNAFIPIISNTLVSNSRMCLKLQCVRTFLRCIYLDSRLLLRDKTRPSTENDTAVQKPTVDYYFRDMKLEDIPKIIEIRRSLKIHDCYSCLQTWNKIHPEGVFLAEDIRGRIVATGGFVHNSEEICTGGLVYVDPQFRKSGIGKEILQLGLEISQGRIICGNSVESMARVYYDVVKTIPTKNYSILRNVTPSEIHYEWLLEELPPGLTIKPFQDDLLGTVNEYDYNLMGYDRSRLLELSCREENSRTFVALNNGKCVGFGSVKLSCLGAARVGPLYADDAAIAETLLKTLLKSFPQGRGFMMMTLSNNDKANSFMTKLAVPTTQRLVHVFSKRPVEVDADKVYAHFDVNFCVF